MGSLERNLARSFKGARADILNIQNQINELVRKHRELAEMIEEIKSEKLRK